MTHCSCGESAPDVSPTVRTCTCVGDLHIAKLFRMVLLYPPNNLLRYSHLNVCRLQYYSKRINTRNSLVPRHFEYLGTIKAMNGSECATELQVTNPRMRSQYEATNLMQGLAGSALKQGPG